MPNSSPLTLLRQEHQTLTSLLELLKEEQQCLVRADTDGLNAITPRKSEAVQTLSQLSQQRHEALGAAGFPSQDEGMQAWLAVAGDAEAAALWSALLDATREAKELNRVNGMLINKQMANNQVLINAMRTSTGGTDGATYGPDGQTNSGTRSRRFVVG